MARAVSVALPDAEIVVTGDARWARMVTAAGRPVADVRVVEEGQPAGEADIILSRTDLHRGGILRLASPLVLTLPRSS